MSATFTPGPLCARVSKDGTGDVGIVTASGHVIAETFAAIRTHGERATDEAMANARLFCAADGMLEMLRICVEVLKNVEPSRDPNSDEILSSTISGAELVIQAATGSTA